MGLLAKRILRNPNRRLEADQLLSAALKKDRDASQASDPDDQSRISDTESSSTNNASAVESIHEELIPACLRSYLPQPEGGYWNRDVNKKRKRQSTDRLFESVTDDVVEKALAEYDNEAKPAFRIPRKTHFSNPPNGPRETSFMMSKKRPVSMTNLPIATKSNTAKKRCVLDVGPNKSGMNLFEAMNPRSNRVAFPDRSPSSLSIRKPPPSIEWKATFVPMHDRKKKKKKRKKKMKKIPKRKVKLEEEIANQQLADFFRVSVHAAEDFMNMEQGSRYRSKGDIGSPVIFL